MSKQKDFEQFYSAHYDALFCYALRLVDDVEASRDIVGDALGHTWANIDTIEPERLKNYIYTLIHHKCVDHVRHKIAAARYAAFYLQLYHTRMDDEGWQEHERLIETVMQLLGTLTDRTRQVLELCYFEHKRYDEVAAELGISVSGVKKHIVTALRRLREEMAKKS